MAKRRRDDDEMQAVAQACLAAQGETVTVVCVSGGKATNFAQRFNMWRRRKVDEYGLTLAERTDGIKLEDYEGINISQEGHKLKFSTEPITSVKILKGGKDISSDVADQTMQNRRARIQEAVAKQDAALDGEDPPFDGALFDDDDL